MVCRNASRWQSAGFAVVSVMHPAMMLRGVEARFTDRTTGREIRPASTRHQLTDYINAVPAAGWTLEHARRRA